MSTSVRLLASRLVAPLDCTEQEIYCSLRVFGFIGDVANPVPVLLHAKRLSPQFLRLRSDLVGLAPIIDCFLRASCFLDILVSPDEYLPDQVSGVKHQEVSINPRGLLPGVSGMFSKYEKFLRRNQHDCQGDHAAADDWLSVSWLWTACLASIKGVRSIVSAQETEESSFLAFSGLDFSLLSYLLEQNSGPALRSSRLADVGIDTWFSQLDEEDFVCIPGDARYIGRYLMHLASASPALPEFSVPGIVQATTLDLSERFLTRGHFDYPRPAQRQSIQKLLRDDRDDPSWQKTWVEQLVMAIALVTGRTCGEALNIRVNGECPSDDDVSAVFEPTIQFVLASGYQGQFARPILRLPTKGSVSIDLPLPERIGDALKDLVGRYMGGALIELLPASSQPWSERVNAFVESCLQCSAGRAQRIVRDTLARELFAASRNLAVVGWLNPSRFGGRLRRSSALPVLTHYLDPHGIRTYKSFWLACGEIFGGLGAVAKVGASNCHTHGNHRVSITQQRAIAIALQQRITAPDASVIAIHNAFVDYCLLMLVVATAHRASNTPFWFARDLRLDDRLVFVCDKIVVGSEARFVPLPDTVVTMLRYYQRHLVAVRRRIGGSQTSIVRHIDGLLFSTSRGNAAIAARQEADDPECGYFFKVSPGGKVTPVNTRALEMSIRGIMGAPTAKDFRAAIADALWGMGVSGSDVSTFLGHAGDLHPFGPASVCSVQGWADRLRPIIAEYLEERGWSPITSPLLEKVDSSQNVRYGLPNFDSGLASYEGRNRETQLAKARVRKIAIQILSEELIGDSNQTIDDSRFEEIRGRVEFEFGGDRKARDVIHGVLSAEIEKLRGSGVRSAATAVNLVRQDPSPVGISFGRHLEIASRFRNDWINRVGSSIGGEMDWAERAAQLSISLVVHSAVLDPERVSALVSSVLSDDPGANFGDLIVLRGEVRNSRYEYDVAVAGDSITAALWIGLQRELRAMHGGMPDEARRDKLVEKRFVGILDRLLGRMPTGKSWRLSDFCLIFRAWWFLRLPGNLFSIAVGDHIGPAPHLLSERSLLAAEEPEQIACKLPPVEDKSDSKDASAEAERAIAAIGKLVARASGSTSMGTAHNRRQRMNLRRQLSSLDYNDELSEWVEHEPIVDLAVGFLSYLLEHGGPRQANLKFNSIRTYQSVLVPYLIREGWGQSIEDWDEGEFEAFYCRVLENADKPDSRRPRLLYEFHQFLRSVIDAPYVRSFPNQPPVPQRCRTSIVTVAARCKASERLSMLDANQHPLSSQACALLGLGFDYGLRSAEAAGLEAEHFDSQQQKFLVVQKNVIRDLKTSTSRRVISAPCPNPATTRRLNALRQRAIRDPSGRHFLFGSDERPKKIADHHVSVRVAKMAMRSASANLDVVFHDARATMATEAVIALHALDYPFPPLLRAINRLVRPDLSASGELQKITSAGESNPFVLDSVARVLGHRSVDTLLNVYFRASFVAIAGYTFASCQDVRINDQRLATMLRLTRSAIPKQRKSLSAESDDGQVSLGRLVTYSIALMYSDTSSAEQNANSTPVIPGTNSTISSHVPWELLDRLLTMRKENSLSLVDLQYIADTQWALDSKVVANFLDRYRLLVTEVGFDDFEPDNSELLYAKPLRGNGVVKGRAERASSVARAHARCETSQSFRDALIRVCRSWSDRVAVERARFSCRTQEELNDLIFVLDELGVGRTQLDFTSTGPLPSDLEKLLSVSFSKIPIHMGERASRGNRNVKVSELGVNVRQLAGAIAGDGRDTHRLFAVLSCCLVTQ